MQRAFVNVLSASVTATATFYEELLGMSRHFDSDWFIILTHPGIDGLEYGILQRDHPIVPPAVQGAPAGMIMTFVVADCGSVYRRAQSMNAEIIAAPTDMPYGQRRMLLRDPDGTVLDISAPTAAMR
ncbi:MAG: VOC family protein [Rhodobacteraceae bacterium]|nr:VOC family protein [Paracoccaceae bacterium]